MQGAVYEVVATGVGGVCWGRGGCMQGAVYEVVATGVGGVCWGEGGLHAGCCV